MKKLTFILIALILTSCYHPRSKSGQLRQEQSQSIDTMDTTMEILNTVDIAMQEDFCPIVIYKDNYLKTWIYTGQLTYVIPQTRDTIGLRGLKPPFVDMFYVHDKDVEAYIYVASVKPITNE